MKINKKALDLVEVGLKSDTVAKMSESQVNVLHSKLISEITMVSKQDASTITKLKAEKKPFEVYEKELEEDQDLTLGDVTRGEISQDPHQKSNWDGTDDDSDPSSPAHDQEGTVESEMKEGKKKKSKTNPWAICTAQLGKEFGTKERHLWSAKEKNKYERCVKDVKKSIKEGKNPVSSFLENEIMRIVEKHIPPMMTKKELMQHLLEDNPAVAPSKPKTSPDTKPGKPKERPQKPKNPLWNPNPGEKPAPKAKREEAKNKVIDLIGDILNK